MPKIDLLPCPFCGETDLQLESSPGFGADVVICRGCLATFSQQEITCEEDLIKAWNTRASGWISCSEKLPEVDCKVLICGKTIEKPYEGCLMKNGEWTDYDFYIESENVTHWMPTPELPKEVQHDEK